MGLVFILKISHRRKNRIRGRLPQTAQRGLAHGEANILQRLPVPGARPAMMGNTVQYFHLPFRAYLAGETFAAALMGKETADLIQRLAQIGPDGDCGYENALIRFLEQQLGERRALLRETNLRQAGAA